MTLPRPCLDCGQLTTHPTSRCPLHARIKERQRTAHRPSSYSSPARVLRRQVNREGGAYCAACGAWTTAPSIEIDHRVPLAFGGADSVEMVRPLCRPCHRAKTKRERR